MADILVIDDEPGALGTLRKTLPEARILAMSGGGFLPRDQALSDASLLGADGILEKPFSKDEVLEAVEGTLRVGGEVDSR